MLAVVMILAIAAAVALPQLGGHDDVKLASASRELTANLLFVQNRAISMGKTQYVAFDCDRGSYEALDSIDPPVRLAHPDLRGPFHIDVGLGVLTGVSIQSADFDGHHVLAFDALGTPYQYDSVAHQLSPMKTGSIVFASGSQSMTVTVTPLTGVLTVK
jgi:type II secretory pathway pseudopilin PulG